MYYGKGKQIQFFDARLPIFLKRTSQFSIKNLQGYFVHENKTLEVIVFKEILPKWLFLPIPLNFSHQI